MKKILFILCFVAILATIAWTIIYPLLPEKRVINGEVYVVTHIHNQEVLTKEMP